MARNIREAPANEIQASIAELGKNLQGAISSLGLRLQETIGLKSPEATLEELKAQAGIYAEKLQSIRAIIEEEAQKNANILDGVIKAVNDKVAEATKIVESKNPELVGEVKKIPENIDAKLIKPLLAQAGMKKRIFTTF